jgi:hypothetical protein
MGMAQRKYETEMFIDRSPSAQLTLLVEKGLTARSKLNIAHVVEQTPMEKWGDKATETFTRVDANLRKLMGLSTVNIPESQSVKVSHTEQVVRSVPGESGRTQASRSSSPADTQPRSAKASSSSPSRRILLLAGLGMIIISLTLLQDEARMTSLTATFLQQELVATPVQSQPQKAKKNVLPASQQKNKVKGGAVHKKVSGNKALERHAVKSGKSMKTAWKLKAREQLQAVLIRGKELMIEIEHFMVDSYWTVRMHFQTMFASLSAKPLPTAAADSRRSSLKS